MVKSAGEGRVSSAVCRERRDAVGGTPCELRGQCRDLQERDVFLLQYGASDETLREGCLAESKVRGRGTRGGRQR